jgi:sterol 3beta-glucosyltransferase
MSRLLVRYDVMPSPTRADTDFSDEILTPEAGVTSFDHFFSKTVAFEQALASAGCIEPTDPDTGFEDLVVKDLSPAEKAIAHHAAKLRVTGTSWTPTNDITGETPVEEPDSTLDDSDSSSSSTLHDEDPVLQRSSTQDKDSWKLEPKEVIDLLIEEFGPLAADDEEEKLILEVDAGFIKDVTILVRLFFIIDTAPI